MSVNYDFAHRELRELALKDPETLLAMLSDAPGLAAFARVWNRMEEAAGQPVGVTSRDFAPSLIALPDGTRLGILGLPKAEAMCEVVLAGVAVGKEPRYFTLEVTMRGADLEEKGNVLCEWKREDKGYGHANYGVEVSPADAAGFSQAIGRILAG